MSLEGPYFQGWCHEADRGEACAATLAALAKPRQMCNISVESLDQPDKRWRAELPVDKAVEVARASFLAGRYVHVSFGVTMRSGRTFCLCVDCFDDSYGRRFSSGPLHASRCDRSELLAWDLEVAIGGGPQSVEVAAAIVAIQIQHDVEDLLSSLCAPDTYARVMTGVCTWRLDWGAPLDACSTYNANIESIARDLALSWVHLHDGDKTPRAAGMSMDALHARIDAAPRGARVAVKSGAELTREAILKALATSPEALLEALEASSVPDDEWRAIEPLALETIEASKQGAPTREVDQTTRKHTRFIERHAPYHVRRLPNGGVMLATHPYRTLWPLWADALFLLGIRT